MGEAAGLSPNIAGSATAAPPASPNTAPPAADGERILLLECRLEQARSALEEARADADRLRVRLADAAARESDHARRYSTVHQELAEARAEIVSLHEALDRSQALRAELEGHFFESGARDDAGELLRLRREVLAQRDRCITSERAASRLRTRVDDLLQSREALLSRVAAWQCLIRQDGPEAVDLAEFMAELRRDILDLEHRTVAGERREAVLRERLLRAGMDPGEDPSNAPSPAPSLVVSYREPEDVEYTRAPAAASRADDDMYLVPPNPVEEVTAEPETPATDVMSEGGEVVAELEHEAEEIVLDDILAEAWLDEEDIVDEAFVEAPEAPEEDAGAADEAVVADPPIAEQDVAIAAQVEEQDAASAAPVAEEQDVASAPPVAEEQDVASAPPVEEQDVPADVSFAYAHGPARAHERAVAQPSYDVADAAIADEPDESANAVLVLASPAVAVAGELSASNPDARAAAYGRMVSLLEGDRLADHLRAGLADPHPRVRRRTVLAAAAARSVALDPLLDPLRADPDPQVRRVVREVLRHASAARPRSDARQEMA